MTVGYRATAAPDPVQGVDVPIHLLYPSDAPARVERFGMYELELARDAPFVDGPVVVVSHGTGGTPWLYRGLAAHLAGQGFVVALVEHPGNRRGDDALSGTAAMLEHRPRHVRRVLDALGVARAAVIGHSLGGYTALAAAGGRPHALPNQTADGVAHPVAVERDPRIRAVVLLAPALPWFLAPGSLAAVDVPVLARLGERDPVGPMAAQLLARELAGRAGVALDVQTVANAGHFSFVTPFPPAQVRPDFPPSQDPPGFDRAAYQPTLHADVTGFLRAAAAAAA
jgi:predicted dienelactone hydrolase